LAEKGMLGEAFEQFEKAVELNPDNASAQVNLGNVLATQNGRLNEGLMHLNKGVELDSDSATGQNDFGIALARAGSLDEAIMHIQRSVELAPNDGDYHYNLGRVLAAKGSFKDALSQFEQAAKLSNRQRPTVLQMLAAMYSENGRYAEAIATARRALELANAEQDSALAAALQGNLRHYEAQEQGQP
jgi:tetratricopeptide (TPR) repeat protein